MKAMLLTEYKQLQLTDLPKPEVGPNDVLIQVRACGICGSDIHGYDGSSGRRIPPLVMGHEASGVIAETGRDVNSVQQGDRVTFDSTLWCGKCEFCRRGAINLCDYRQVLGVSCGDYRRYGAFAEYVVVPEWIVYPLPDSLAFEHAALIEAVSVAVHAVARTPVTLGGSAVVVGTGMIGLLVLQALRLAGAKNLIAVDLENEKLNMAMQLGATNAINAATAEDIPAMIRDLTGGFGAEVCVEATGLEATVSTAVNCVRKGGHVTLVGNLAPQVRFPLQNVVTRELTVAGSCASQGEYPACISLLADGAIDVAPLITALAPLDEGPSWFQRLYEGEKGAMKVVLLPTSGD